MELRYLRYFVAVAQELHFGRAAQRVGIVQPALSQQIKALEEELGTPLLRRNKRRVELTPAGRVFLGEARKTLAQAEQAVQAARQAGRGETGHLAIGFVSSAAYGQLINAFRVMRTRFPGVTLSLQDLTSEEQVGDLQAQRLDVGLVRPPVQNAEALAMRILWREPLMVALSQRHRLAREKAIPLAALKDEPFLQVPRELAPGFYDQILQHCARAGFVPVVFQEARTFQTIINLIAAGMGLALVPESLRELRHRGVVYRPLKAPAPTSELAALWRREDTSPVLQHFLEILWQIAALKPPGARR